MKVNKTEKQTLSVAIDKVTEGLDEVIELYNNVEEDLPLIKFNEVVVYGRIKM
jgi:hypothetical protein